MFKNLVNVKSLTKINLTKYKLWEIEGDRRGDVIKCLNGTLWVTQEGDLKDYVLEPGQDFWVTKPGIVVVQALENSQFKYNRNELQNHVEINYQRIPYTPPSRIRSLLR